MKWTRTNSTGFTLIEMLVVISIMALLSALLLPALRSAMEKSHEARCRSNLRQLASAMHSFIMDNDGMYPSFDLGTGENPRLWYQILDKEYLGDSRSNVWRCPSNKNHVFHYHGLSYGYNTQLGYYDGVKITEPRNVNTKVKVSQVVRPSQTILLADGEVMQPTWSSYMDGGWRRVGVIHRRGANIAWLDGHVDWHLQEEIAPNRTPRTWPKDVQKRWGLYGSIKE